MATLPWILIAALAVAGAAGWLLLGEADPGGPLPLRTLCMADEVAAVVTLGAFVGAQAHVQASGRIDVDADGVGEYGGFLEMSGALHGRMTSDLVPPVLPAAYRDLTPVGEFRRSGYLFRIYLPGREGLGVGEAAAGFGQDDVVPDLAERAWCCYAWPQFADTGARTFFTNQVGNVLGTKSDRYAGSGNGPAPDAAFASPSIVDEIARDGPANDGGDWVEIVRP